ncbi:AMIN domain-containing protein [Caminibacter sp.]
MKYLVFAILFVFSFARINPFEPVIKPNNNTIVKPQYFKKAKVYLPSDARILKKIIFVYQSVSSDINQKEVEINKNIDFHSPIIITHHPKTFGIKKYYFGKFILYIKNKKIFLHTKDKLLRAFFLVAPFRLVLDFKAYSNFPTIKKNINSFVKKVVVGSHGNFYRVVIYLDANYKYKIKKRDEGIEIDFF